MGMRSLLAASASAVTALAFASPALASPSGRSAGGAPGARGHAANLTSQSFAGYELEAGDGHAGGTATIVLPKLKCGTAQQAIDPSVGAYVGPGPSSSAGVFVGCYHGAAHYWPAFTLNGTAHNFPKLKAKAGDTVVLRYSIATTATKLSVTDKTTKSASKKLTGPGTTTGTCCPWTGDSGWYNASNVLEPVPQFKTLTFTHTVFLGMPFAAANPSAFDRYNSSTLQISTSPFATSGEKFTTTFQHS